MLLKISHLRKLLFSKASGRRAAKLLQLRPCMTSLIDALKELDPVAEIQFYNWFIHSFTMELLIHI